MTDEERDIVKENQKKLEHAISQNLWGMDYKSMYRQVLKTLDIESDLRITTSSYLDERISDPMVNLDAIEEFQKLKGADCHIQTQIRHPKQLLDVIIQNATTPLKELQQFMEQYLDTADIQRIKANCRKEKSRKNNKVYRYEIGYEAHNNIEFLARELGKSKRELLEHIINEASLINLITSMNVAWPLSDRDENTSTTPPQNEATSCDTVTTTS